MRIPQELDLKKAKNLCPPLVQSFYENFQNLHNQSEYQPTTIWNVDELGANASRNGIDKVFASKGMRSVHTITLNEREWINVLTSINANSNIIPNYYIFKGVRSTRDYLAFCEHGSIFDIQKSGWVDDSISLSGWTTLLTS